MARVLDFNELQRSFMDIKLCDPERTEVHLDLPTEKTINELENMQAELARMEKGDRTAVDDIYDLAARLMNSNFDLLTFTGESLRTKYGMNLVLILQFYSSYMSFIEELKTRKN